MIIVTGAAVAREDSFEQLLEECLAHTARSRAEPGCISHAVHIDCENPLRLVFFEEWADDAALRVHFAQPDSHAIMKAIGELAADTTPIKIYQAAIPTGL